MGVVILLAFGLPALAGTLDENRELIRKTVSLMAKDPETMDGFYYLRRREVKEFDANGRLKKRDSTTIRREAYGDAVVQRTIERDDAALNPDEERLEQESIERQAREYRENGPPEIDPKRRKEELEMMRQLPEAFDYESSGTGKLYGRQALVFTFHPHKGYKAPHMRLRMFEKTRGKVWIDQATLQLLLVEAEVYEDVNVGFGLIGTIGKGTRFHLQRAEAAPGEWVTEAQNIKFDARVMVFKTLRREIEVRYSEFAPLDRKVAEAER